MKPTLALVHEYDTPGSSAIAYALARDRYMDCSTDVSVFHSEWNGKRVLVVLTNDPTLPLVLAGGRRIEPPIDLVNLLIDRRNATRSRTLAAGGHREATYPDGIRIGPGGVEGN